MDVGVDAWTYVPQEDSTLLSSPQLWHLGVGWEVHLGDRGHRFSAVLTPISAAALCLCHTGKQNS